MTAALGEVQIYKNLYKSEKDCIIEWNLEKLVLSGHYGPAGWAITVHMCGGVCNIKIRLFVI